MTMRQIDQDALYPVLNRRRFVEHTALGALVFGSLGCFGTKKDKVQVEPNEAKIERAHWFLFQNNTLFTAYAHMIGRSWGGVKTYLAHDIVIYNPSPQAASYIVEVEIPGYAYRTQANLRVPGRSRGSLPGLAPTFELPKLYNLTSPVRAEAQLRLTRNGNVIDVRNQEIIIEPVNRVRWAMQLSDGQQMDVRPMVVTLITPSDRNGMVSRIVTDSANLMPGRKMVGYTGANNQEVILQSNAIYEAIKRRGLVYTNIPGSFFDKTQQVRLPSQSLDSGSANCIDGALLFASVFEALGMEPVLVFITGHVLVGVRLGPRSPNIVYIETTVLSQADFKQAVTLGFKVVGNAKAKRDPNFLIVDVKTLRSRGIISVSL